MSRDRLRRYEPYTPYRPFSDFIATLAATCVAIVVMGVVTLLRSLPIALAVVLGVTIAKVFNIL